MEFCLGFGGLELLLNILVAAFQPGAKHGRHLVKHLLECALEQGFLSHRRKV